MCSRVIRVINGNKISRAIRLIGVLGLLELLGRIKLSRSFELLE
jgi:hypothetical protein